MTEIQNSLKEDRECIEFLREIFHRGYTLKQIKESWAEIEDDYSYKLIQGWSWEH